MSEASFEALSDLDDKGTDDFATLAVGRGLAGFRVRDISGGESQITTDFEGLAAVKEIPKLTP